MSITDYPDRRFLICARELRERLDEALLIDVRPAEDFALGRIGESRHLDLYGISLNDTSEAPLQAFLSIFKTLFGARGVTRERPVVIYDHESGERAARAVWLLAVLGHPDARMLDGGTQAWLAAGHRLERVMQAPELADPGVAPPTAPPFKGAPSLELVATRFDVRRAIEESDALILDVRRESEYRGTERRARRTGTIPGAVHVFWREHLDARGALRAAGEVRALYYSKGVTPERSIIAVCHGGYRSANTLLALTSLGYPRVRNYVGSWAEWGNRDDSIIVVPER
jgi:thiosulfate/3-mercaptopyruvate sulfurtransferase